MRNFYFAGSRVVLCCGQTNGCKLAIQEALRMQGETKECSKEASAGPKGGKAPSNDGSQHRIPKEPPSGPKGEKAPSNDGSQHRIPKGPSAGPKGGKEPSIDGSQYRRVWMDASWPSKGHPGCKEKRRCFLRSHQQDPKGEGTLQRWIPTSNP
ncbi:hypothetical protein KR026_001655 [Drosophila bipectinata]|nr:hypothetical protein KR026_001655 [Drosophila bipectinata]